MDVIETTPHPRSMPSEHILEQEVQLAYFAGRTRVSVREFLSYASANLAEDWYIQGRTDSRLEKNDGKD